MWLTSSDCGTSGGSFRPCAQLVGQLEDADAAIGAGDDEAAVGELDVDHRRFHHVRGDLLALLDQLVAGLEEGLAADQRRLRAAGAAADLELVGIALQQAERARPGCRAARPAPGRTAWRGPGRSRACRDSMVMVPSSSKRMPPYSLVGGPVTSRYWPMPRPRSLPRFGALGLALVEAVPVGGRHRLVEDGGELAEIVVHARRRLVGHLRRARCGCAGAARSRSMPISRAAVSIRRSMK